LNIQRRFSKSEIPNSGQYHPQNRAARFQLLSDYKPPLSKDHSTYQNVIHEVKRDNIVVNQGQVPEKDAQQQLVNALKEQIVQLTAQVQQLLVNDAFQKGLIQQLMDGQKL